MSEKLKEEFVSIGAVLISDEGPSFGTPIFVNGERRLHFVQSSANGILIDEFVALPFRVTDKKNFVELRSNHTITIGSAFLFGFRDKEGKLTIAEKSTLQLRLRMEIDEYARWPFLSFAIARFLEHHGIVRRIIKTKEIASAIAAGELERPAIPPVPGYMEDEEIGAAIADGALDEQRSEIEEDLRRIIEEDIPPPTAEGEPGRPSYNNEGAVRRNIKAKEVASEAEVELDRPDFTKPLSPLSFDNWPDIRVKQLTKMWNAGLSVGQIAAELGNIPRTAVIEKINKLRLPDLSRSADPISSRMLQKSPLELDGDSCHWPVGDPASSDFHFCGAPVLPGRPYCNRHSHIAYGPAENRRRKQSEDRTSVAKPDQPPPPDASRPKR